VAIKDFEISLVNERRGIEREIAVPLVPLGSGSSVQLPVDQLKKLIGGGGISADGIL
jgi:hypothetical protein